MLGLGSSVSKSGKAGPSIVRDGLVLKHGYARGPVQPCSTGAASFTASNTDYIDMGDVCDLGTGDFSISCWVNLGSTTTDQYIISKFVDANNYWYLRTQGSSQIQFYSKVSGSDVIDRGTGTSLAGNTWYHVAITADRGTATKSYVNGVEMGSGASSATDLDNAASLYFGRADSSYLGGYIANVGIWSAALTQPQVKSIMHKDYASLSASEKTNLVSWWNLDETLTDTTVLDNHYGGGSYLGSELVTDGPFNNGTLSWNENSNWTYSDGTAVSDGTDPGDTSINQSGVMEVGKTYVVSYEIISFTSGPGCRIRAGSGTTYSVAKATPGVHSFTQVCTGNTSIYVKTDSSVCSIDNVSVKLVNGNTGTLS